MTKKSILLAIVLIVVLSCVYAGSFSVDVQGSPFSFQYVKRGDTGYTSKYGFGFEAGINYDIGNGLSVGTIYKYCNFSYDELSDHYQVICTFMPSLSWTRNFNGRWSALTELAIGVEARIIGDVKDAFFGLNQYVGVGYDLSEKVTLTAGLEVGLCIQNGSWDLSSDIMLGARFGL